MEGYNRFLIVGLLLIELVCVYAENHQDLSAQKSNDHEDRNAAFEKSPTTIENAGAQPAAENTPRILKKRSNPNLYRGMSWDDYDFTLNEAIGIFAREAIVSAAQRMKHQRARERALEVWQARRRQQHAQQAQLMQQAEQVRRRQQAEQAQRAQHLASQSQFDQMPASPQFGQRPASPRFGLRPRPPQYGQGPGSRRH